MDIVELALAVNACGEIKMLLKSEQKFVTIQQFKDLLKLQLEKEELKQTLATDQQQVEVRKELKLKEEGEKRKNEQIAEEQKIKAEQQEFLKVLSEFNKANNAQWEIEIDNFVPQL